MTDRDRQRYAIDIMIREGKGEGERKRQREREGERERDAPLYMMICSKSPQPTGYLRPDRIKLSIYGISSYKKQCQVNNFDSIYI
jgi:hypothetical protein